MTILVSGPTMIVCGSTGVVNRGPREEPLPRGLGKWAGTPLEDLPWPVLHAYDRWVNRHGECFESWAVEDEWMVRVSASAHCRRRWWWDEPWWRA